ncbi:hypothetical protein L9F63_005617, partial [Diploptera punctata]
PLRLQFIWHSRQPNINCPIYPKFKFISEEYIHMVPEMGHFRSNSPETFTVFCNVKNAEIGKYRSIL